MSEKLLKELIEEVRKLHDTIGIMQQDINCIRNGEYDKPKGADVSHRPRNIREAIDAKPKADW